MLCIDEEPEPMTNECDKTNIENHKKDVIIYIKQRYIWFSMLNLWAGIAVYLRQTAHTEPHV